MEGGLQGALAEWKEVFKKRGLRMSLEKAEMSKERS